MKSTGKTAIIVLVAACACSAQKASNMPAPGRVIWEPPTMDWPADLPRSTVPQEIIAALRVADMPIALEETKLDDAQKHFGGAIGSSGDAGDAEGWLCLYGGEAGGRWIFWLLSGEIDGPAIGGFQWRRLSPNEAPDRRCRLLRKEDGGIKLPLAIHPGMTQSRLRKILGQPTAVRGKTLFFCHEHDETIDKLPYTSSNDIAVVLRGDMVWAIEVIKTTVS